MASGILCKRVHTHFPGIQLSLRLLSGHGGLLRPHVRTRIARKPFSAIAKKAQKVCAFACSLLAQKRVDGKGKTQKAESHILLIVNSNLHVEKRHASLGQRRFKLLHPFYFIPWPPTIRSHCWTSEWHGHMGHRLSRWSGECENGFRTVLDRTVYNADWGNHQGPRHLQGTFTWHLQLCFVQHLPTAHLHVLWKTIKRPKEKAVFRLVAGLWNNCADHDLWFQPLFLYLPHQAVHSSNYIRPLMAPWKYLQNLQFIENENRRLFAGNYVGFFICHNRTLLFGSGPWKKIIFDPVKTSKWILGGEILLAWFAFFVITAL